MKFFLFFKQKTAYEMRIRDWGSDVCSSDLAIAVYRGANPVSERADEADVLFAARLLATFLVERRNMYTPIPALLHEYQRIAIVAAHSQLERISMEESRGGTDCDRTSSSRWSTFHTKTQILH